MLTEGIIDYLRSLEGTAVAAVIRDKADGGGAARKVSLRSTDGDVDVSAIARKHGRRRPPARRRLLDRPRLRRADRVPLRRDRAAQLVLSCAPGAGAGVLLCDKPAGITSHDVVAAVRRERGGKAGHAGTLDPFATGLLLVLLGRATRLQRYLLALPKTYAATARLGWRSSTGDPDGELTETGRIPERSSCRPARCQRVPMTSAVRVGGERLYKQGAPRARRSRRPSARSRSTAPTCSTADAERASFEIECSAGTYVRTLIETLGDAYCEELRRTGDRPLPSRTPASAQPAEALAFMPARGSTTRRPTPVRTGGHRGAAAAGAGTREPVAADARRASVWPIAREDDATLRPRSCSR